MTSPEVPADTTTPPAPPEPEAPRSPWWRRTLRFVTLRVAFWYFVICMVVMFSQRSLIYHPQRTEKLSAAESQLPKGAVHEIAFETSDGLALNGWHILRTGQVCETPAECQQALDTAPRVVLFFHGNGGDRRGRVEYYQIFSGAGADVFVIDYRGYADNPGDPTETGLYNDARGLWKYATEERGIDPERIVIFGESLGGGVAVRLAQEVCAAGTPPAALVVRSTFSCLADAASCHYPWLPTGLLLWDRYPSCDSIQAVTCPVLMLHGTEDRIVPYELGKRLFQAAPAESANQISKQFITLEGADHNGLLLSHRRQFTEAVEQFLAALPEADTPILSAE